MAAYSKDAILPDLAQKASASAFLAQPAAKNKFPLRETEPAAAYQLVHDELLLL